MNITHIVDNQKIDHIYIELKAILSGCDTLIDAMRFTKPYCDKYPNYKQIILNMLNGYQYFDTIDQHIKIEMIRDMIKCESKDDGKLIIEKIENRTYDDVMKRVMNKLLNKKKNKKYKLNNEFTKLYTKKCPHCNHLMTMRSGIEYVVCGYPNTNIGYDWTGCGKDWCFQCGKMLCKRWELHKLHSESNRTHDDKCCEKHAIENEKNYIIDYCHCNTVYVNRGEYDIACDINDL